MLEEQSPFDLRDIFGVLRRRARLIVVTLLVVLSVTFVFLTRATPLYTATALVKIDPQVTNLLDPNQVGTSNASVEFTRLETEVEILNSSDLALQTIRSLDLQQTKEFGPSISLMDQFKSALGFELPEPPSGVDLMNSTLRAFQNSLSARRRGLTYIVAVEATTADPELSARIANTHAATYIQDQVTSRSDTYIESRDILQGQLLTSRTRLEQSNDALRNYIETNVIRLADESGNAKLAAIGRQLQDTTEQLLKYETSVQNARNALAAGDWESLAAQVGDEALSTLDRQRRQLELRLNTVQAGTDEAFDIVAGLAELENQIIERGDSFYLDLETQMSVAQDDRISLLDDAQTTVLESELTASTLADIYSLQQEANIAQRQYDQLLGRIRELETQAVLQVANGRVVSGALVSNSPSYPNKRLVFALALVIGFSIGTGIAFLKEFYFGGIISASQLRNILQVPMGGVIPKVAVSETNEVLADRIVTDPLSLYSESFRKLRASIDEEIGSKKAGQVILVTSAIPAEGKSTTALALARTYAAAGKQTLLIDADLRNPSIHGFLGAAPEVGLLEYLIEQTQKPTKYRRSSDDLVDTEEDVEHFYVFDTLTNAGVILGQKKSSVPTDAPLQASAFVEMINGARLSFDVVIIDTAPLIPVVDTRYIIPLVDVAVLCVRFGEATQTEVRAAFDQLKHASRGNVKIVSALNCFDGAQLNYKYDAYYGGS